MHVDLLLQRRLTNQRLAGAPCQSVPEAVSWLGAVQSQEFNDAKWSVAQRVPGLRETQFDQAFNEGLILRTHVLRPTWHFVAPADVRWMLDLTAPRVKAFMRTNDRKLGLDEAIFSRSNHLIEQALANGEHLTRTELADVLKAAGIALGDNRLAHLLMRAELEGIMISGALRGRYQTYALMAYRVPETRTLQRDEALAELAKRYFVSHGPATDRDFSWWSGLTLTDARLAIESIKSQLTSEVIDGKMYWFVPTPISASPSAAAYLLPNFDEYVVAYTDRDSILEPTCSELLSAQGSILNHRTALLNGRVVGTWTTTRQKQTSTFGFEPLRPLSEAEQRLIEQAVQRYQTFYGI